MKTILTSGMKNSYSNIYTTFVILRGEIDEGITTDL